MATTARKPLTRLLLAAALLPLAGQAADVYLDTNGITAGSGNIDTTWTDVAAIWGSANGTGTPLAWTAGDTAILAAGTDYTGTRTLTVSGTQVIGGLKLASGLTGLSSLTVTGGTLDFGSTGGTLDFSAWNTTGQTFTLASTLVGSGGLEIRAFGDLSASGGGNGSKFILSGTNTFTGNITVKSGLLSATSNAGFGDAANRILLDGGGLLDYSGGLTLARDIEILSTGTLRSYGSTTTTHTGALVAAAGTVLNRTDGGTIVHSGDLSGFLGTYNVQRGITRLTGSQTICGNWNLGEGTTGASLAFNRAGAQRFEGAITQSAGSTVRVEGSADLTFAGTATGSTLLTTGTGSILRIVDGASLSFNYYNIGEGGGSSGHIYQTGGTVTVASGGTGMRIGHWNNNAARSSLYQISGGTLDATAASAIEVGRDGEGDLVVGGGSGAATVRASGIALDTNGDSGGYDSTLTILANGTVEVAGALSGASAQDRTFLSGGTLRKTGETDATWTSALTAVAATTSALDVGGRNLSLSSSAHTGAGTVNLTSATGSLVFSQSGNHTVPWILAGATAITKTGNGTLTLTGASTHTGTFTVSAGRLDLAAGASLASNLVIAAGDILGGKGSAANATFQSGSFLHLAPAAAGSLTFGDVSFTGAAIRFDAYLPAGTASIPVYTVTGTRTGTLGVDLVLDGAASHRNATLTETDGVATVGFTTKDLTWSGAGGGTWDVLSSARFNADADTFAWGDHVTLSGPSANTTVTLSGELRPGSLTVAGDTNYTLASPAGGFLAGPMTLTKAGSSTLTVNAATAHTFTGGTILSQGTLIYTGSVNNGLGTGPITLGDAATGSNPVSLLLTNGRTLNNPLAVSSQATGDVTLGFSGTGASTTTFSGNLALQRDVTLAATGSTDRLAFSGVISGTGNITVAGGARVSFSGTNTWTGNLTITGAGTSFVNYSTTAIPDAASVIVDTGAIFGVRNSETIAGLSGSGNLRPNGGKPTLTVGSGNTSSTFSGSWTGDGSDHLNLTKTGNGTLTLSGPIASPGDLTIAGGTVTVSGTGAFSRTNSPGTSAPALGLRGSGTLRLEAGADLALRRNSDFTGAITVAGGRLVIGHANAVHNASTVTLAGGTLAFDNRGASFTALSGDARTGGTLWTHTTTTDFSTLHNTAGDVVPGSHTHAYVGKIYLTAGQWSFAKQFDDGARIAIGGTEVLNHNTWNLLATATYNAAADGWYDIDLRVYQGTGGVGPTISAWANKGIGIKKGGATTTAADYTRFDLDGLAALGSAFVHVGDLSLGRNIAVSAASTIDTSLMVGAVGSTAVDGNGAGGDVTLSGVISGAGTLTKTGAGTLTLSGANTHTGRLVIQEGRVVLPTNSTYRTYAGSQIDIGAATLALTVGSGTRYDFGALNYNFLATGGGAITVATGVNWVAQGNWTFTTNGGARNTISGEGLNLNGSGRSATFNVARGTDASIDLDVSSGIGNTNGGITKSGAGILRLSGSNSFSGNVTLSAGTLIAAHSGALGTGSTLNLNGGTLHLASDTAATSKGVVLGASAAIILDRATAGAGLTTTFGLLTFGDTRTLTVTKGANVTSGTATLVFSGFPSFGPANKVATFDLGADVLVNLTGNLNGTQVFARVVKDGAGTLALSGENSWWDPASGTGLVTVNAGTLELRHINALGDGGTGVNSIALRLAADTTVRYAADAGPANHADLTTTGSGATLVLDRTTAGAGFLRQFDVLNLAAGTLSVLGGPSVTSGTAEARFNATTLNGATTLHVANPAGGTTLVTLAGAVSGSGHNLTKSGNGTLTLAGANTLSGSLTATGGILNLTNTNRSVASVTATDGATVNLGATNLFVSGHGEALAASRVLTASNGGTLIFTSSMDSRIGNITLSGGTLTSNRGLGNYDVLLANVSTGAATVNVTGSAASTMNGTGGIHLQGVQNFAVADVTGSSSADLTVSLRLDNAGTIGGALGGVNKTGAGNLLLAFANTYTGATTVADGTLTYGITNAVNPGSALTLGSASARGTLDLQSHGATTSSLTFGGLGGDVQGTGALTLGSGATVTVSDATANTIYTDLVLANAATFSVAANGTLTLHGNLTGSAGLTKTGAGALELRGNNDFYSGAIALQGGTTRLAAGMKILGTGVVTLTGGAVLDLNSIAVANTLNVVSGSILNALNPDSVITLAGSASVGADGPVYGTYTVAAAATATFAGEFRGYADIAAGGQAAFAAGLASGSTVNILSGASASLAGDLAGLVDVHGSATVTGTIRHRLDVDGALTLSGDLAQGAFLNVMDGGSATVTGAFAGAVTVKSGAAATFAGTSAADATLEIVSGGSATLTGAFGGHDILLGGSLVVDRASDLTLAADITGAGTLEKRGSAKLTLTGANTLAGALTVSAGTLAIGGASTLGASASHAAAISLADGATLSLATSANQTLAGIISGDGALAKSGAGTLTLSGANTFAGGLSIAAGRVNAASLGALGSGAVEIGAAGTLGLSLALAESLDLDGLLAGSGLLELSLSGPGALSLGGVHAFTGTVRLVSGIFDNSTFGGDVIFAGGQLLDPGAFAGTTTVTGAITDISQLPTSGTLVLDQGGSIDFGQTEFTGTIKFRGGSVSGEGFKGTLEVDAPSVAVSGDFGQGRLKVGAGKSVTLSDTVTGTLVLDGGAITGGANLAGRLELAPGKALVLGTTIDTLGAGATLAVGPGSSVDLAGASTAATIAFAGGSLANAANFAGTLQVTSGATLSTDGTIGGNVTLASGTTLAGNGTFTGTVTAGSGAVLSPGSSPGLTTYETLSLTGGTILQFEFFSTEETVTVGEETKRGYDTLVADTLNFGTAGELGGGRITLRLATLTNWSDSVSNWSGTEGFTPAEGSSLIFAPGELSKEFTLARFDASDRDLTDDLNITSWFAFDTDLFEGTGASGYSIFVNAGDTSTWELTMRVVPEPSTYGLILGALSLAAAARRRRRKIKEIKG